MFCQDGRDPREGRSYFEYYLEAMKDTLSITLVQSHLHWENAAANLNMFSEKLEAISDETDLILLPEMFSTGFSMNAAQLAEPMDGPSVQWMVDTAKQQNTALAGSLIISENEGFYNRLFFVFPDGTFKTYDKRHTFTLAGEHEIYNSGNEQVIIDYLGWKIFPLVCYDLRFPVWARNTMGYDLLLYLANWPKKRIQAWDALLKARAIENMSYCAGVNRVGLDGNGHEYTGHSAVYDVLGEQVSTKDFERGFAETVVLTKAHIEKNRRHLRFLDDRDAFSLG